MVTTFLGVPLMKIENCTMADFYTTLIQKANTVELAKLSHKIRFEFYNSKEPMTTENVRRIPGVGENCTKDIFALAENFGFKVLKLQTVYI